MSETYNIQRLNRPRKIKYVKVITDVDAFVIVLVWIIFSFLALRSVRSTATPSVKTLVIHNKI